MRDQYATYQSEFTRDFWPPQEVLDTLTRLGWTDVSWHNDACPCFTKGDTDLWCRGETADARHYRFTLSDRWRDDVVLFGTDSVEGIIAHLHERG